MTAQRLIGCAVALCLSLSSASAQEAPPPDAADAVEMIELMLGRVPARHETPLAAMHGLGALYARLHAGARADTPGDLGLWILLGDIALRSSDAGLTQSFAADLLPLYRQDPDAVLKVLSEAPWLATSACHYLSAYFGSEDRPEANRAPFLEAERNRIREALPGPAAETCFAALSASL
ncbi:hypothetical protein [Marivita sp. XM-24bin2]|jgi:hypothetical protein|uniref:hypothetical protein n=1 Tax=unclassified Marivita TaxID=2632480 RepID=UPI000D793B5E|nr:hypothetical protein [Marivita sp. XM-24bin2]MCR9109898.1 hypothetical protein [Paracoccaceae bacterium]PWL36410.1 MAG: hypothetical protein DCO97_04200 [Marivita sp. XM-24bin2]